MANKKQPYKIIGKQGETFSLCQCQRSTDMPFCSGAHEKHPPKKPYHLTFEKEDAVYVCVCGGSKTKPFCDGTHNSCPEHDDYMNRGF